MSNNTSQGRITSQHLSPVDLVSALSGGNAGAMTVLVEWLKSSPMAIIEMLIIDGKRLYEHRIWDLYKLCGRDIERFKYHVAVELPNQETGELSVTGPYSPDFDNKEFWEKRRFGQPGSFWALENPPSETDYKYPIS